MKLLSTTTLTLTILLAAAVADLSSASPTSDHEHQRSQSLGSSGDPSEGDKKNHEVIIKPLYRTTGTIHKGYAAVQHADAFKTKENIKELRSKLKTPGIKPKSVHSDEESTSGGQAGGIDKVSFPTKPESQSRQPSFSQTMDGLAHRRDSSGSSTLSRQNFVSRSRGLSSASIRSTDFKKSASSKGTTSTLSQHTRFLNPTEGSGRRKSSSASEQKEQTHGNTGRNTKFNAVSELKKLEDLAARKKQEPKKQEPSSSLWNWLWS